MWGDNLKKEKDAGQEGQGERINMTLTPEQSKKFNAYILAVANKKGKMPSNMKTRIGRMAIDEWLDKHGEDLDVFEEE
jgi:hypothetical protein